MVSAEIFIERKRDPSAVVIVVVVIIKSNSKFL